MIAAVSDGPDDTSSDQAADRNARTEDLVRELRSIDALASKLEPYELAQGRVMSLLFEHLRRGHGRLDLQVWNEAVEHEAARHEAAAVGVAGEAADRLRAHADALRAFKVQPPRTRA